MNRHQKQRILWLDCTGGLVAGAVVLLAARFFSDLECLPLWIIRFVGFANLAYGCYSLWVTVQIPRKLVLVKCLALANMAWLAVCIAIVVTYWNEVSVLGIGHMLAEGIYVASLGVIEWRWRNALAN